MCLAATGSFRVEWRAILLLSNVVGIDSIDPSFRLGAVGNSKDFIG